MLFVWGGMGVVPCLLGAPEKGRIWDFDPKWHEPVVHFGEWSTGCLEKGGKPGNCPEKDVSQWSTLESGPLATRKKAEFRALAPK